MHAHCTEGVTRSEGREGASGNEDLDGAGTGTREEVKERREEGAGTGPGVKTRGQTPDGDGSWDGNEGSSGGGIGSGNSARMETEGGRKGPLGIRHIRREAE